MAVTNERQTETWYGPIAEAPSVGIKVGDKFYDPSSKKWYMWDGSQWAEQFSMGE